MVKKIDIKLIVSSIGVLALVLVVITFIKLDETNLYKLKPLLVFNYFIATIMNTINNNIPEEKNDNK